MTEAPAPETPDAKPVGDAPVVRLVSGSPNDEEMAALVTVLAALGSDGVAGSDPDDDTRQASGWAAPAGRLRTAYGPRPGGWRGSALPR